MTLDGVAENRGGHGLADGDVEALPVAVRIRRGETDQAGVHAADQFAAGLDVVKRRGRREAGQQSGRRQRAEEYGFFHTYLFLSYRPNRAECEGQVVLALIIGFDPQWTQF